MTVPSLSGTTADANNYVGFFSSGTYNTGEGVQLDGQSGGGGSTEPCLGKVSPGGGLTCAFNLATSQTGIFSDFFTSNGQSLFSEGLGTWYAQTSEFASTEVIGISSQGGATVHPYSGNWIRIRITGPNNILPSITYGSLQSVGSTINLPATINYGQTQTLTGTCTPGDTCQVWNTATSVEVCSGTTTCSATTNILAAGTYNFNAIDINSHLTTGPQTLTVNKGVPTNTLTTCSSGLSCTTTGTFAYTQNNILGTRQIIGNLYLNNLLIANNIPSNTVSNSISSSIGTFVYVFNSIPSQNFTSFSSTVTFSATVPFYGENVLANGAVNTINQTSGTPYIWNTYYPIKLYTLSPSNSLTYTLTQTIGASTTTLESNVVNANYIPPANQITGNYIYSLTEFQVGNANTINLIVAANTLNMQDVNSLTFNGLVCSPHVQYLPNCANATFVNPPSSWYIQSDVPVNTHANTINGDTWSNANLSFTPQVILNYPFVTFSANLINNPMIPNSITQNAFALQTSNTNIYTRELLNFSAYNTTSQFLIANALTTYSTTVSVNNYSFPETIAYTANNFQAYVANSNFKNPRITLINQTQVTSATGYAPTQNNWFNTAYNSTIYANLHAFLDSAGTSSFYTFTVFGCGGYATSDYLSVQISSNSIRQVQQYLMTNMPFQLPLVNGYSYKFLVYNANKQVLTSTATSSWASPITFTAACANQTAHPIILPNINTSCSQINSAGTSTCTFIDTQNIVDYWNIKFINQTSPLTTAVLYQVNVSGSGGSVTYTFPSNSLTNNYYAKIVAFTSDPIPYTSFFIVNIGNYPVSPVEGYFFVLIIYLIAFVMAWYEQLIFLIVLDASVIITSLLGIVPFNEAELAFLIVGSVALVILRIAKNK